MLANTLKYWPSSKYESMKILSYSRVLKSSHISSWRQVISVAEIAEQLRALSLGSVFVV